MTKVVLDTNVVVSALLNSEGPPSAIFNMAVNRRVQLVVSNAIVAEYEEVLSRPKFSLGRRKIGVALKNIRNVSISVSPKHLVSICSDPDDNIFLECAQEGQVDYLITGNQRDFPPQWKTAKIMSARDFLQVIADVHPEHP